MAVIKYRGGVYVYISHHTDKFWFQGLFLYLRAISFSVMSQSPGFAVPGVKGGTQWTKTLLKLNTLNINNKKKPNDIYKDITLGNNVLVFYGCKMGPTASSAEEEVSWSK